MAVTRQIVESWRHPARVMRRMLAAGPREDRALMLLMAGCLVVFVGQWPRLARLAGEGAEAPLQAMIAGALLGWLFIMPIVFYGIAALSHLAARAMGGQGSWTGARLALFWAVLAVSPLMLLQGLVAGLVGPGPALTLVYTLVTLAFFAHWLINLREAEFGPGAVAA